MANVGQIGQKMLLDYINGIGTSFVANVLPQSMSVGLGTGVPGTLSGSGGFGGEMSSGIGYNRQALTWGAAAGTPATANNIAAVTFGPFSSIASWTGVGVFDTRHTGASANVGNVLWAGTLATPRITQVGDSLILAASALTSQIN
jgi:hypothetical protein